MGHEAWSERSRRSQGAAFGHRVIFGHFLLADAAAKWCRAHYRIRGRRIWTERLAGTLWLGDLRHAPLDLSENQPRSGGRVFVLRPSQRLPSHPCRDDLAEGKSID